MIAFSVKRNTNKKISSKIQGHSRVKVGFPKEGTSDEVITKAVQNHFGVTGGGSVQKIPERPFLANAMRDNKRAYRKAMRKAAPEILTGEKPINVVLNQLGIKAQGDVQNEITNLRTPPNSPITIERKGSSNPLIDTGEMRQAVTWVVYD